MKPYIESAKRQKLKQEDLQLPKEMFEDQAKRRVALGLILGEIIHKKNLKLMTVKFVQPLKIWRRATSSRKM